MCFHCQEDLVILVVCLFVFNQTSFDIVFIELEWHLYVLLGPFMSFVFSHIMQSKSCPYALYTHYIVYIHCSIWDFSIIEAIEDFPIYLYSFLSLPCCVSKPICAL